MKFSFCLETLYTECPFIERLTAAKKDGIESIEIWGWRDKDSDVLLHQMEKLNISLSNMSGNRQFGMIDPYERRSFLQELSEAAAFAKSLNCSTLMLLSESLAEDGGAVPISTPLTSHEKVKQIIACGIQVSELAENLDLQIAIEPLNDILDHPRFFLNSSQLAFQIIKEINHPRVKVLYDIYHMAMMEENILRDIEDNFDYIGYFHMADKPGRHEPGSGNIDFRSIWSLLKTLQYDGVVGFEFYPSRGNSQKAIRIILNFISNIIN
ncbi:MAG: TIM barrel protein [bacterium]